MRILLTIIGIVLSNFAISQDADIYSESLLITPTGINQNEKVFLNTAYYSTKINAQDTTQEWSIGSKFYIGATLNIDIGRAPGYLSSSIDAAYVSNNFSVIAKTSFSFPFSNPVSTASKFDTENNYPAAHRAFNITEMYGTWFFHSAEQKKSGRPPADFGDVVLHHFKNTIFDSYHDKLYKFGARIGLMHDQNDTYWFLFRPNFVDNATITSYSVNSLSLGLSTSFFALHDSDRSKYIESVNIYFDIILKLTKSETYRVEQDNGDFSIEQNLDLFPYAYSFRYGIESTWDMFSDMLPFSTFSGFETGVKPTPLTSGANGFYVLLKMGVLFYKAKP